MMTLPAEPGTDADEILASIKRIRDRCETTEPAHALRANELLGKFHGLWRDKLEVSDTSSKPSEELEQELNALRAKRLNDVSDLA